jgi:protein-S-isoprenylcysteine O-methyltransferase Ste14
MGSSSLTEDLVMFRLIVNVVVIAGVMYLTFGMALAGWVASLRKGQAVTLLPERGNRRWPAWAQLAFVLLSLVLAGALFYALWIPLPLALSASTALWLTIGGLVLFLAGLILTLWARRTLGAMWGISTSRKVKLLPDHQLIQTGPYALVRHPMYLGWWLSLIGLVLIYHTWLLVGLLAMSLLIFYLRARREEAVLAEKFGEEWQAYVARSKFLIPFIY